MLIVGRVPEAAWGQRQCSFVCLRSGYVRPIRVGLMPRLSIHNSQVLSHCTYIWHASSFAGRESELVLWAQSTTEDYIRAMLEEDWGKCSWKNWEGKAERPNSWRYASVHWPTPVWIPNRPRGLCTERRGLLIQLWKVRSYPNQTMCGSFSKLECFTSTFVQAFFRSVFAALSRKSFDAYHCLRAVSSTSQDKFIILPFYLPHYHCNCGICMFVCSRKRSSSKIRVLYCLIKKKKNFFFF